MVPFQLSFPLPISHRTPVTSVAAHTASPQALALVLTLGFLEESQSQTCSCANPSSLESGSYFTRVPVPSAVSWDSWLCPRIAVLLKASLHRAGPLLSTWERIPFLPIWVLACALAEINYLF